MYDFRYKYISFSQSEKDLLLADLRRVGHKKILGYLPRGVFYSITKNTDDFLDKIRLRGLEIKELSEDDSGVFGGAIFVYNQALLKKILDDNHQVLNLNGWPSEPESFIFHLKNSGKDKPLVFKIIKEVFGGGDNVM